MVTKKSDVPPAYREESRFYTLMSDLVLRQALLSERGPLERVYVITDALPLKRKRSSVTQGMKASLKKVLGEREYILQHQRSSGQVGLQAADYMNWAVFRKWERNDLRSYDLIRSFIRREVVFDWSIPKK